MKPSPENTFWTRVRLSRDLANQGRWASLSRDEKVKAMYLHAVDAVTSTGKMLREAPLVWKPTSPLAEGPTWDLSAVRFPKPPPVVFAVEPDTDGSTAVDRKAAGLA